MAVVLFTCLVLGLAKYSTQFDWPLGTKCEDYPEKVEECWVEKSEVPVCDGKDPLLECVEDAQNDVRHCKEEIRDTINHKYFLIKTLHDAMCEDTDLREAFLKIPTCWHTARACASSIASLSEDEDPEEEECGELLETMENCNQLSGRCQEIQQNFTIEVFEASPCKAHVEGLFASAVTAEITIFFLALPTILIIALQ